MTSLSTIGREQQHLEGRTVRDIVEYSPDQVNEVWCRKIFRQILQSLELQYAMHMPHRAITPDTVVFHDNGEPLLVPSDVPAPRFGQDGAPDDELRDDLTALASIVHYAITRELAPTGPLSGRAPEGYSESLIGAVDLCMAPAPSQRPRTIEALRDLLGIVALGPAVPPPRDIADEPAAAAAFAPASAHASAPDPDATLSFMNSAPRRRLGIGLRAGLGAGLGRWQRWALAAGGGCMLVAVAVTLFKELRDSGSYDQIALSLPQQAERPALPAAPAPLPAPAPAAEVANAPPEPSASAQAYAESAMGTSGTAGASGASDSTTTPVAEAQAPAAPPMAAAAAPSPVQETQQGGAPYRLQIQPWGTVYVDGVDRGVSPPVKRLVLAPGHHTVRVANPNFHDRVLEIDVAGGEGRIAVDFGNDTP